MNPVAVNAVEKPNQWGIAKRRKGRLTEILRDGDHFGRAGEILQSRCDESPRVETNEISSKIGFCGELTETRREDED